jgi:hypothetical protein
MPQFAGTAWYKDLDTRQWMKECTLYSAMGTEKFPFYIIKYPNAQNNRFPPVFLSGPAAKSEACLGAD